MRSRPRDFIYTEDDLFFATTSYFHPEDRILSFLRYIPDPEGERSKNGRRYSKVDSKQAYHYLKQNFPQYLYDCHTTGVEMMGVPIDKVKELMHPEKRLREIVNDVPDVELLKKVIKIANIFHEYANIPYDNMGISGSILPDLYDAENSDIDFVVYGLNKHRKALNIFAEIKDKDNGILKSIIEDHWKKLYEKRIKDSTLSYDEFRWYEKRKNNRGTINGTLFDILATRDWDEIKGSYGDEKFEPLGTVKIECQVNDALAAFDNPAIYKIENVDIIEGPDVPIEELASFTHTYAGQAVEGEAIVAKGKLERVKNKKMRYRLVVGTTRESIDEYIKLKNLF